MSNDGWSLRPRSIRTAADSMPLDKIEMITGWDAEGILKLISPSPDGIPSEEATNAKT